jgi:hypothetical protein
MKYNINIAISQISTVKLLLFTNNRHIMKINSIYSCGILVKYILH